MLPNGQGVKGLTQEEAARLAGTDPATLARWEKSNNGTPGWMRDKLNELCGVLGVVTLQSKEDGINGVA